MQKAWFECIKRDKKIIGKAIVLLLLSATFFVAPVFADTKTDKTVEDLLNKGELKQAIAILKDKISSDKDDFGSRLNLGNIYLMTGKTELAEKTYEEALVIKEDSPLIWNNLGLIYLKKNDVKKAAKHFMTALKIEPSYQDANLNMAELQLTHNNYANAIDFARKALGNGEKDYKAYFVIGRSLKERGELKKAASNFAKAIQAKNDFVPAKMELAFTIISFGEYERSQAMFRDILEDNQGLARAHYGFGAASYYLKENELAEKALKTATKMQPDLVDGYVYLGLLNKRLGELEKAKKYFLFSLDFQPENEHALLQLALVEEQLQNKDSAISFYQKVLVVNKQNFKALNNLALLHEERKEFDIAKNLYLLALQAAPGDLFVKNSIKLNLAGVYRELGDKENTALLLADVLNSEEKGSSLYKRANDMKSIH